MVIASLNVNGLCSHFDELRSLIKDLEIHIIALNETKIGPEYPKALSKVSGYQQERLERNCHGGGVSIYIRNYIKYKPRNDVPLADLDLICIELEPPKSKFFIVLAWYRPPNATVGLFNELEVLYFLDKGKIDHYPLGH